MSEIPSDLRYAKSHEWVKIEPDGTATVGITDHAQSSLGDITYVQLPKLGAELKAGDVFGALESVKAASDLYAPVGGKVSAVNEALDRAPEMLNRQPYKDGWIFRMKCADPAEASRLLDAEAYAEVAG